jgi:S1-C subfamily serine protease
MLFGWNDALNDLIVLLAGLYPDRDKARFVIKQTRLSPDEIDFSGVSKVFWMRVVEEATKRDKIHALINVAKQDFDNVNFAPLEQRLQEPRKPSAARRITEYDWKGPATAVGGLEKVIGAQPTFLPISFLEIGLHRAKAVARVEGPQGFGTGFLTRNNLLITNNHVLPSPEEARGATVWFNYEETAADSSVAKFTLDPDAVFATSQATGGDDWTAVRVSGDTTPWGYLTLADNTVKVNDYVNIVQHPNGLYKRIALYHNIVAYVGESRVQYLTDTEPGSSGSPVFDSQWRVVALHHSGGWLPEPGSGKVFFRNEGIHVRALIKGLSAHKLLVG